MFPKGMKIYGRKGTTYEKVAGQVMGTFTPCQLVGCRGLRVWLIWPDGKKTKPCSEGIIKDGNVWRIQ